MGLALETIDYVFMDRPWLQQADAPSMLLSWKGLVASPVPLHQIMWKREPVNAAFVAFDANLSAFQAAIHHVQKLVNLNTIHVVVLGSTSGDVYEGFAFLKE